MQLEIETVNVINLLRRPDLAYAQQGAWQARGCPPEKINIFEAHDGLEYQSRGELAQAAVDDGFAFFNWYVEEEKKQEDPIWMGIGELACMWSIAALLREIANKEGTNAHFYVLADRFLRKKFWEAEALINELPDFNFIQFRGYLPPEYAPGPVQAELHEGRLFWSEWRKTWIADSEAFSEAKPRPPIRWYDESRGIEHNGFKIGDGILLMTPEGASWMLALAHDLQMQDAPYELMLMHVAWEYTHTRPIVKGAYSMDGPICSFTEWYNNDLQAQYMDWEGQFDYRSVLGKSDIDYVNEAKGTQNK